MRVGVVAVQGDFQKHINALDATATPGLEAVEIRTPDELAGVDRIIIPGGESTTVGLLMQRYGLGDAIIEAGKTGMPIWGTCMGMILLAREIAGREQYRLGLLDITVERNHFGAQVHSFEDMVEVRGMVGGVMAVFIRAPIVTRTGPQVKVLATYEGQIVAVQQGNIIGTSFHPELTSDTRFHELFLSL